MHGERAVRAVGVTEFGGPERLSVLEIPDPEPGAGEVGIRVRATAVSPTDTVLRSGARAGALAGIPPPYVPGMEAAGVLESIGAGASTELSVGDDVMAIVVPRGAHGAYAERVVVPARSVARAPAGSSYAEAATLPMNGLTARAALDALGLSAGQSLAVTGAAGAVGGYVVQLAQAAGLLVLADASEPDRDLVEQLGADVVLERGPGFVERVGSVRPEGVDGVVDAALLDQLVLPMVRDGGRIATLRGFRGEEDRGISWHPIYVRDHALEQEKLDELGRQVESGVLTLRVARVLPAEAAAEAHRLRPGRVHRQLPPPARRGGGPRRPHRALRARPQRRRARGHGGGRGRVVSRPGRVGPQHGELSGAVHAGLLQQRGPAERRLVPRQLVWEGTDRLLRGAGTVAGRRRAGRARGAGLARPGPGRFTTAPGAPRCGPRSPRPWALRCCALSPARP